VEVAGGAAGERRVVARVVGRVGAPAGTTPPQYFSTIATVRLARLPKAFARSAV
jgi:hypothetical protein